MHLRNKPAFPLFFNFFLGLLLMGTALAGPQTQSSSGQQNQSIQPTPLPSDVDPNDPALPIWMRPANRQPTARSTPPPVKETTPNEEIVPTNRGRTGQVTTGEHGQYVMRALVENVTLPVTVVDERRHLVTDLKQSNFVVYENGEPQQIVRFSREDVPVSIGILVDNSGSMREKRQKVSTAVLNLIKASNPSDEVAIVNFNDEPYLDQEFTNNLSLMHEALDRLDSRGGTALYDAIIASADHLAKAAKRDKKVLLVVTDGEDNESSNSLEQAIRAVQDENGPVIYTIGILGTEGKQRRAKRALEAMSLQTGGVAFFPKNLDEVDAISQQVARDIRNQYSITYKPSNPPMNGEFRQVRVVARASGYRDLIVRTKSGYFAGAQKTTAGGK